MDLVIKVVVYVLIVGMFLFEVWLSNLNYKNRTGTIPESVSDIYDKDDYNKWLEYYMAKFKFSMIVNTLDVIVFVGLLVFGVFPLIASVSENVFGETELQIVMFMGLYYGITFLLGLYPSYYNNFVIEETFGFNKSTKKTFALDKVKGLLLTALFGGGLIYGLATLYYTVNSMFFVYAYVSLVVIVLCINALYVKVFVPMFNKLRPLEDSDLKTQIEEFAKSVGYEVSKISIIDASKRSTKLNAYFSGFGKFKHVVLYDTLIEKMSTEEIVAVLAHEIGHNKHKHILFNLVQTFVLLSVYLLALMLVLEVEAFSKAFGFDGTHFGFAIIVFGVLLSPLSILLNLITSGFSRKHEFQADNFASTKYSKAAMESSLKVLAKENYANLTPHPLYVKLTYSHPPIAERIEAIRKA